MSSNFDEKVLNQVVEFLRLKSYQIDSDSLVSLGGKKNGSIDLKVVSKDLKKILFIELRNTPVHIFDLIKFYELCQRAKKMTQHKENSCFILSNDVLLIKPHRDIADNLKINLMTIAEFLEKFKD